MEEFINFVNNLEMDPFVLNLRRQYLEFATNQFYRLRKLQNRRKLTINTNLYDAVGYLSAEKINIKPHLKKRNKILNTNYDNILQDFQLSKPEMPKMGDINFDI